MNYAEEMRLAIWRKWQTRAESRGAPLFFVAAPADTALPYVTFFYAASGPDRSMEGGAETATVRFVVHTIKDAPASAAELAQAVVDCYDKNDLLIPGFTTIVFWRVSGGTPELDDDGGYMVALDFEAMVQVI